MNLLSIILSVVISASIDSTTLWIGNQTLMHLQVQASQDEQIVFPQLGQEITQGVEILERMPIDTVNENAGVKLTQDLLLTSFRDSLYYIDSIPFVANGDTIFANGVTLNVIQPFIIDTTNVAIFDVKDIIEPPIWWWGIIRWVLLVLLIVLLGFGIWWLVRRLTHKDEIIDNTPKEPLRPADIVALEQLDAIKEEKIWQSGRTKDYYSAITEVLKEYISRVFDIDSVEMTTYEILGGLKKPLKNEASTWKQLKDLLTLADLVKFAKWSPLPDENEKIVKEAIDFVNNTCHFIPNSDVYNITTNENTNNSSDQNIKNNDIQ